MRDFLTRLRAGLPVQAPEPPEPTVAQVRDEWLKLYSDLSASWVANNQLIAEQNDTITALSAALEDANEVTKAARNFMVIMAQRAHGGHPLFKINDEASPAEIELLRNAILTLQALLEGTEVPELALEGRVLN